jgi:outer membrane receptor protein involved in Fe transport
MMQSSRCVSVKLYWHRQTNSAGDRWRYIAFGIPLAVVICSASVAQTPAAGTSTQSTPVLPLIQVTGYPEPVDKSELTNDPGANPASVTVLRLPDEKKRNNRSYEDIFKPIMGVAANNFDQGGVGFGITMRGFSERSNGGNVAVSIDGVPVNLPSHTLTNGYADLTPLIPELFDVLTLTRGPFDVRSGANALGGSLQITTLDNPQRGVAVSGGNFHFGRGYAALPFGLGGVSGYASLVGSNMEGYRTNSELRQINTFDKVNFSAPGGVASVRVQVFADEFGAPGFLSRTLVENGTLGPRTAINSTDGGKSEQQILAFNYKQTNEQPFTATAYLTHSKLDRYSNRTSTVPISETVAGQNLQQDMRWTYGATVEKYFRWALPNGMGADVFAGAGVRRDDVESRQFNTIQRVRTSQTENTDFTLLNPYAYLQADFAPWKWLKLTGGIRYDRLSFDVEDHQRNLDVSPDITIVQPKGGIIVTPLPGLNLFANYGRSFLPPSATGGQLSRNPDLDASRLASKEIGIQYRSPDGGLKVLVDAYRTTFTNEILNQPPPLFPIYLGPSERNGYDAEIRGRLYRDGSRTVSAFINYSKIDGELVGRATGTSIPDVAEFFLKYGADVAWPMQLFGAARNLTFSISQVWEGPKPITATESLKTRTFSRIDAKLSVSSLDPRGISGYITVIGYPDRRLEETAFTFGTPITIGVSPKARITAQAGLFIPF